MTIQMIDKFIAKLRAKPGLTAKECRLAADWLEKFVELHDERIMRIKHNLAAKGIKVDKERTAFERKIIIQKLEENDPEFEEVKDIFSVA